jgi:polysaccharide biosynthesis/export protein
MKERAISGAEPGRRATFGEPMARGFDFGNEVACPALVMLRYPLAADGLALVLMEERVGELMRLFSLVTLGIACISGAEPVLADQDIKPTAEASAMEDYQVGLQDVLSVLVWREPELSVKEVVVRSDGKISLPLINDIQASGLTTKQLREQISERLRDFVASPNVAVTVVKSLSRSVTVMGQVGKPGAYLLGAPMTVLDVLARAGGLTEMAKAKSIRIVRTEAGKTVQYPFNYKDVMKGKNLQQNITLKSGDIILVP